MLKRQTPAQAAAESGTSGVEQLHALSHVMIERLLDAAERDPEWRRAFEHALDRQKLHRGSVPNQVWRPKSMLRNRFIAECESNGAVHLLARSCPPVVQKLKPGRPIGTADIKRLIAEHGPITAYLCVVEAQELGLLKSKKASSLGIKAFVEEMQLLDDQATAAAEAPSTAEPAPPRAAPSADQELRRARHDNKLLERKLQEAKKQIARLTQRNQELKAELDRAERELAAALASHASVATARADHARESASLKEQVEELKKAKLTLERRLEEQRQSWLEEREALLQRLAAAEDAARATDARAAALQRQLDEERRQRTQVEALVEETGLARLLDGLGELEGVIAALETFRSGIAAYHERRAAEEQRRLSELEELQRRSAEAEAARQKQAEMEAAWRERELERLANLERAIFGSPAPDTVIIDGHNAVIRAFGREREREMRPRFIEAVRRMADRLAHTAPHARIVLCFDTTTCDNETIEAKNLVIRYCDKSRGGADEAIRDLVESANPDARCLVVSTDYKHVWTDALRARSEYDSRVSVVEAEPLLDYLAALEQLVPAKP